MESFFTRFKNVLVLVAILLAQTIGLAIQVRRPVESVNSFGGYRGLLGEACSSPYNEGAAIPSERV